MSALYIRSFTLSLALGEKEEDRWSGAKRNHIARLYRGGSSEEKMSQKDGEQKAKEKEHIRVVAK